MTTNVLSIGSANGSKKNLLGATAEISGEGTVTPQDANPADTPFLPMFLQMLFVQSQIKPSKEILSDTVVPPDEQSVEPVAVTDAVPTPPISILAGSIDGLARLTMERTQPAMDALKSQLGQTQRPRDGEDASMILPSLFGKNMRMPVANVQEIIQAISFNHNSKILGAVPQLKAKQQSSITLDAEGVKIQATQQILASLTESAVSVSELRPVDGNVIQKQNTSENEYIELDIKHAPSASAQTAEEKAVSKSGIRAAVVTGMNELEIKKTLPVPVQTTDATYVSQPESAAVAAVNSFNTVIDEVLTVASKSLSDLAIKNTTPENEQSAEQQNVKETEQVLPAAKGEHGTAKNETSDEQRVVAERQPQQKPNIERTVEKKGKNVRSFTEEHTMTSEQQNVKETEQVLPAAKGEHGTAKNETSDEQRVVAERQPQPPMKTEAKDYQRTAAEVESNGVKTISGLTDIHKTENVHTGVFKSETVRSMMEQLSKGVAVAVNENHSEMKIILHPEALGEVTVRVSVEEGKVTAKMDVQQVQVKNTIEANMPQLREALTSRGLTMESIEISTAQNGLADGTSKQHQNKQGKKSYNGFDLEEEEMEVVKMYGYNTVEYTV